MATRTDLHQMAAEEAGVVAAGETMTAADLDYVVRRADAKLAELHERGLTPFDIEGDIPTICMLPLARVIAGDLAVGFGLDVAQAKMLAEESMRVLYRLKEQPHFGTPTRATYY